MLGYLHKQLAALAALRSGQSTAATVRRVDETEENILRKEKKLAEQKIKKNQEEEDENFGASTCRCRIACEYLVKSLTFFHVHFLNHLSEFECDGAVDEVWTTFRRNIEMILETQSKASSIFAYFPDELQYFDKRSIVSWVLLITQMTAKVSFPNQMWTAAHAPLSDISAGWPDCMRII